MLLKRKYDPKTIDTENPVCTGVTVDESRLTSKQHFSKKLIKKGQQEGWLTADSKFIAIKCDSGKTHKYEIVRSPAKYCSSCSHSTDLIDDVTGEKMRLHIALDHKGKGHYEAINYFECKQSGEK